MRQLDLSEEELHEVLSILKQYVPECEVWAYGSRVKGLSHATSDLDLVVLHTHAPTSIVCQLTKLRQAFQESTLPIFIDVMDWTRLPEDFRQEIQTKHIKLYIPALRGRNARYTH